MTDTIGVVIPVYNVESYLSRCMDSVLAQSYADLEIILVDDGSTDKSPEICDMYATADKRVKVYHKTNGGVADARNFGIKNITTKYFTLIDPDDFVKSDYIQNLVNIRDDYSCDIAITGAIKIIEGTEINETEFNGNLDVIQYDPEAALEDLYYRKSINVYPHGKLYPKVYFENEQFNTGEIYEDLSIMHRIFSQAKKIGVSSHSDYYYVQRPHSIVNSEFNIKKMIQISICENIVQYVSDNYPRILDSAKSKYFITSLNLYVEAVTCKASPTLVNEIKKAILKYNKDICRDKNNTLPLRLIGQSVPISLGILVKAVRFLRWMQKRGIVSVNKPF